MEPQSDRYQTIWRIAVIALLSILVLQNHTHIDLLYAIESAALSIDSGIQDLWVTLNN